MGRRLCDMTLAAGSTLQWQLLFFCTFLLACIQSAPCTSEAQRLSLEVGPCVECLGIMTSIYKYVPLLIPQDLFKKTGGTSWAQRQGWMEDTPCNGLPVSVMCARRHEEAA